MTVSMLRCFTTVAQLENISKAAFLLHLTQSSLSKNLAKLEEELGMPLFDRAGKKIVLNAQGKRFLDCCNRMLRELDTALADMRQLTSGTDNRIRVGMTGLSERMIECMADFRRRYPETEFDVDGALESRELPDINEFDVLIYPAGGRYDKFNGYPFYEERYFLAVSSRNELSHLPSVTPRTADGQNFVFLRNGRTELEYPYALCTAMAVHFASQSFVDSRELHRQMIASGMAVGFVAEEEASSYRSDPAIRLIPVLDGRFARQMMICFRREKHLSPAALAFRDFTMTRFGLVSPMPTGKG